MGSKPIQLHGEMYALCRYEKIMLFCEAILILRLNQSLAAKWFPGGASNEKTQQNILVVQIIGRPSEQGMVHEAHVTSVWCTEQGCSMHNRLLVGDSLTGPSQTHCKLPTSTT